MLQYDIHFFAIFLLIVMIPIIMRNNGKSDMKAKIFLILIYLTIFIILIEVITEVSNGSSGLFGYVIHYSSNVILLLTATLIGSAWACYVDYTIFESEENLRKNQYYLHVPAIISTFLIVNMFAPFMFHVDQNNIFHRDPLHELVLASLLAIFIYVYMMVQKNRDKLKNSVIWGILLFVLLPTIFEASEIILGELPYTFVSIAFSIILVYLFTESVGNTRDKQTDLFTRQKATDQIKMAIRKKDQFSVIIIDLDSFKEINDTFGHLVGDKAIVDFAKRMSSLFRFDSLVSRMGGDEFIIISSVIDRDVLTERLEYLEYRTASGNYDYSKYMNFSYGYALSSEIEELTVDNIIHIADSRMYESKEEKKLLENKPKK